jgi:hypothetical protein
MLRYMEHDIGSWKGGRSVVIRDALLTVLSLIWGAILVLVGGRFLALLFGANPDSELVDALYRYSDFWVKPFFNIMGLSNKTVENTGGVFEPASAIAFVVYLIAGAIVLNIIRSATRGLSRRWRHGYDY